MQFRPQNRVFHFKVIWRKKQEEKRRKLLNLTIVDFLLNCHSVGSFFQFEKSAGPKKDSLACLEPLAGQAYRMTLKLSCFDFD